MESVKLVLSEKQAFACVVLPLTFTLKQVDEVMQTVDSELNPFIRKQLDITWDANAGNCTFTLPTNPFAEKDTRDRMLLLQHIAKRTVCYAPAIDVSNLSEIQNRVLQ